MLCRVLVGAYGIFSCGMHAGSSSLTRDRTRAPCIGSTESYPLDYQGSRVPCILIGVLPKLTNTNSKILVMIALMSFKYQSCCISLYILLPPLPHFSPPQVRILVIVLLWPLMGYHRSYIIRNWILDAP